LINIANETEALNFENNHTGFGKKWQFISAGFQNVFSALTGAHTNDTCIGRKEEIGALKFSELSDAI